MREEADPGRSQTRQSEEADMVQTVVVHTRNVTLALRAVLLYVILWVQCDEYIPSWV